MTQEEKAQMCFERSLWLVVSLKIQNWKGKSSPLDHQGSPLKSFHWDKAFHLKEL